MSTPTKRAREEEEDDEKKKLPSPLKKRARVDSDLPHVLIGRYSESDGEVPLVKVWKAKYCKDADMRAKIKRALRNEDPSLVQFLLTGDDDDGALDPALVKCSLRDLGVRDYPDARVHCVDLDLH